MIEKTETTELVRNFLAILLIGVFVSTVPLLVWKTIPEQNEQLLTYILGQLSGMATTALAFFFAIKAGEAALDRKRAENTGKLADAITAAAGSMPPVDQPLGGQPAGTPEDPVHVAVEENNDAR